MSEKPRSPLKQSDSFLWVFSILGALLLVFVLLPILAIFASTGLTALWDTLQDKEVLISLGITFYAAGWATLLAVVSGVPLAYILARLDFFGKAWVESLVNLPIVIPHTAAGIALLLVFGRQARVGALFNGTGIQFVDQIPGIVVGMLFVSLPFLVNSAREAFALIDPELEAVALSDGASRWQAFFRVTLPLAWRGVMAGVLMMWARGISEFGAIVILAYHPRVISVLIYERFSSYGLAAAQPVALLLIIASLVVFLAAQTLLRPRSSR